MSKVDRLLMGCVYLILGIPLIYISTQTPEVEDISKVNANSLKTLLNYPQNSVIAADIGWFQKILCWMYEFDGELGPILLGTSIPQTSRCKDLAITNAKLDWGDNAFRLNRLRMACLIIGIILCILAFFKFIQIIAPKSYNLKQKMKKLQKSKKKK